MKDNRKNKHKEKKGKKYLSDEERTHDKEKTGRC
jgi:hypothetical protein